MRGRARHEVKLEVADDEDDIPGPLGLAKHSPQRLFNPAERLLGQYRFHGELPDAAVIQLGSGAALADALGKPLDDRRLADARLANEKRVCLAGFGERFPELGDLAPMPDDVQLVFAHAPDRAACAVKPRRVAVGPGFADAGRGGEALDKSPRPLVFGDNGEPVGEAVEVLGRELVTDKGLGESAIERGERQKEIGRRDEGMTIPDRRGRGPARHLGKGDRMMRRASVGALELGGEIAAGESGAGKEKVPELRIEEGVENGARLVRLADAREEFRRGKVNVTRPGAGERLRRGRRRLGKPRDPAAGKGRDERRPKRKRPVPGEEDQR